MKKTFEVPEAIVVLFDSDADIIATSNEDDEWGNPDF